MRIVQGAQLKGLAISDRSAYGNFFGTKVECLETLAAKVGSIIGKQNMWNRKAIAVQERLELTRRYLTVGICQFALALTTKMSESLLIVHTYNHNVIYLFLQEKFLSGCSTNTEWAGRQSAQL